MKHSRKLILNRAFPRSVALLLTALSCFSATVSADETAFTMTTIIDSAHGAEIVAGKYEQAIEKIAAIDDDESKFFNSTNLCVAYTKTGNVADAVLACDTAIEQANSMSFDRQSYLSRHAQERMRNKYLALALSNRGVLHAATGDVELARQDFVEALGVSARLSVVKTNLARLEKGKA
jgi:Flp pilus assembly protein TadD